MYEPVYSVRNGPDLILYFPLGLSLMKISRGRPTFMKSLKKVSSGIGALKRVRPFVSMHTAIKIYKGLIEPHFDYCSAVWDGLTQQVSEKL